MSFNKISARCFSTFILALIGLMTFTALADAHPHKRRRDSQNYNNTREVEVQVTIHKLVALDKGDAFSSEDFYARVTIGGQVFKSQPQTNRWHHSELALLCHRAGWPHGCEN